MTDPILSKTEWEEKCKGAGATRFTDDGSRLYVFAIADDHELIGAWHKAADYGEVF